MSVCRPVKQGEAAAVLGYGFRRLLLEKHARFPFPLLGLSAGGFERNHCFALDLCYVRCPRVSLPHGLSPRWVYVFVGGCMACLICLGIGFGVIVACSTVLVNSGY
jgi:hypothetical protein